MEITVASKGMIFRTEKTTSDRFDSLEAAVDVLEKQILKNKSKLAKKFRAVEAEPGHDSYDDLDTPEYIIARTKRFALKPMTVEEAILQMNMLDHQFYLYKSAETGDVNLVYRRKDGTYGLLEQA